MSSKEYNNVDLQSKVAQVDGAAPVEHSFAASLTFSKPKRLVS